LDDEATPAINDAPGRLRELVENELRELKLRSSGRDV
jgi:hypothetical protein